ncbi:hypothetical protein FRC11_009791, partial [Ceratobasidium sp. 423]
HVICAFCYDNLKVSTLLCGKCFAKIERKRVIRIFFQEVNGPLSDEIRNLHDRVEAIKEDNEALQKSEGELKDRLADLTRMVNEESVKLEKAIKDTAAAIRLKKGIP